MKDTLIAEISREMLPYLNNAQMLKLQEVLHHQFWNIDISEKENCRINEPEKSNEEFLRLFITAKRIEGCSEKTLKYYGVISHFLCQRNF